MKPAEQIAFWADRLRDVSAEGLLYCQSIYDKARYRAVQDVALAMSGLAAGEAADQMEPLRGPIYSRPTPLVGGDAAIIDDAGRILLVQRADNHKWAMPGGAFEVGETPAEGVVREALEETGIHCQPVAFVGVFDSRLCGSIGRYHLYHFVFLCRPLSDIEPEQPAYAIETLGMGWFAENALPADTDPGHASRVPEAFRVWHGDGHAFFDRSGL